MLTLKIENMSSCDMSEAPCEQVCDFLETRVKRIQWLIDHGYYEDALFLHTDTQNLVQELDLDLV